MVLRFFLEPQNKTYKILCLYKSNEMIAAFTRNERFIQFACGEKVVREPGQATPYMGKR